MLDEDSVVSYAYRQGLFTTAKKNLVHRHEATERLHVLVNDNNATIHFNLSSMPMDCLSKEQEHWLWNRTKLSSETLLAAAARTSYNDSTMTTSSLTNLTVLSIEFKRYLRKFCSVTPEALVENQNWVNVLRDCVMPAIPLYNCSSSNETGRYVSGSERARNRT